MLRRITNNWSKFVFRTCRMIDETDWQNVWRHVNFDIFQMMTSKSEHCSIEKCKSIDIIAHDDENTKRCSQKKFNSTIRHILTINEKRKITFVCVYSIHTLRLHWFQTICKSTIHHQMFSSNIVFIVYWIVRYKSNVFLEVDSHDFKSWMIFCKIDVVLLIEDFFVTTWLHFKVNRLFMQTHQRDISDILISNSKLTRKRMFIFSFSSHND